MYKRADGHSAVLQCSLLRYGLQTFRLQMSAWYDTEKCQAESISSDATTVLSEIFHERTVWLSIGARCAFFLLLLGDNVSKAGLDNEKPSCGQRLPV